MLHLARLIASTNVQVIFIFETKNSKVTSTALINRFNVDKAHIVPAEGQSGGLWLLIKQDMDVDVLSVSQHFFIALCEYKQCTKKFGLVCVYDDPHHQKNG
jgi:hypothetical protein